MNYQEKVKQFQITGGEDLNSGLTPLREALLNEEIQELEDAIKANDRVEILDALCDIKYVNDGNANLINVTQRDYVFEGCYCMGFDNIDSNIEDLKCGDIEVINMAVYELANIFNFTLENFKAALDRVNSSNMSKFCNTEQEAIESVISYKDKGIDVYSKQNGDKWVIYRLSDNKILKSKYYTPVDLKDLI